VTPLHRVSIASRLFCIAAIFGLALVYRDSEILFSTLVVVAIATGATYVTLNTPVVTAGVVAAETATTGLLIALASPTGVVFLPYLLVLSLIAGMAQGIVGVSAVVVTQSATLAVIFATNPADGLHPDEIGSLAPWLLTSIGIGLLGSWLRSATRISAGTPEDLPYEIAHRLLTQLRTVARRLSSGLDPTTIARHISDDLENIEGIHQATVLVRTEGGILTPLTHSPDLAEVGPPQASLVDDCWTEMEPVIDANAAALPLRVGSRMIGVATVSFRSRPPHQTVTSLMRQLDEHSLRLDTALAFDEIRSVATMEERRRLAREIHDGIAQEVASLGYLVDDLLADAETTRQRAGLNTVREELTRMVSELRLSIYDLRSEVIGDTGLGKALSDYVRQVGSRSNMTVHLSLDESPTRMRAEAEAELLRIAQEAISNARKHSRARNLWVHCQVNPPFAQLEVRDDGDGLLPSGSDSYGLRIMKERAERLDAQLDIQSLETHSGSGSGTLVRVTLGEPPGKSLYGD
jgi:signal transduction histidine kinase